MLKSLKNFLLSLYVKYELVTCIYMFEPWEKKLINGFVLIILSLFIFSSFMYLPSYIETLLQFISPLPIESSGKAASYPPIMQAEKLNVR